MRGLNIISKFLPCALFLFTIPVQKVDSGNILAIQFFGSKSHMITYAPLLDELARRGHRVTLVSPSKGIPQEKSIREISLDSMDAFFDDDVFKHKESGGGMDMMKVITDMIPALCTKAYANPGVRALLNETFDVVMVNPFFNECVLGFVSQLKAPIVLFNTMPAPSYLISRVGGHYPPSFVPNGMLGLSDDMTFPERMKNFAANLVFDLMLRFFIEPNMQTLYRNEFGQDLPSVREIIANVSLVFSNGHFSLNRPRPHLPDVIEVGGIHSQPPKPLPKDLEAFVSKSGPDGFVVFSLGTRVKGSQMPQEKRQMFLNVFSKLKQQVIWKFETEDLGGAKLPPNVKLVKWLPQQDLLGHKGIKLFMTHCGMGGTEEAIYHGVPLVGIPFGGDQDRNAKEAENHGFLVELDWNALTEETLLNAINEVLSNPKYRENVKRLSALFKDQPDKPLDRGVYWMEYVIRHKGAPHLKSAARKLNALQYHSIDVIAAYLAIVFGTIYLIFAVLRWVVRKLCCKSRHSVSFSSDTKKRN